MLSGPEFMVLYLAAAIAAVLLTAVVRAVLAQGRIGYRPEALHPEQVAYLNEGPQQAVYSALAGLRRAGAIAAGPETRLSRVGPLPAGATMLAAAVHRAGGLRVRDLRRDAAVAGALADLRGGLEQEALLAGPVRRVAYRLTGLLLLPVVVAGVARLLADRRAGESTEALNFLVPAGLIWLLFSLFRTLDRTRAADRAIAKLRREHRYLAPSQTPSYVTYPVSAAALAVALFGLASLVLLDPGFATDVELKALTRQSDSSSSCSGCGGDGCSSCGD